MSRIIGIFEAKPRLHKTRVAQLTAEHLREYFGTVQTIDQSYDYEKPYTSSLAIDMTASAVLNAQTHHARANLSPLSHSISLGKDESKITLSKTSDFTIYDSLFDPDFVETARAGGMNDAAIVLPPSVTMDCQTITFARYFLDVHPKCRLSVVVQGNLNPSQALELFNRFENLVAPDSAHNMRFAACLPLCQKRNRFRSLETMSLQALSLSLLNLNSGLFANNIPFEMFEGYLH